MRVKNWAPMSCTAGKLVPFFGGGVLWVSHLRTVCACAWATSKLRDPPAITDPAGRCQGRTLDDLGHGSQAGWFHYRQGAPEKVSASPIYDFCDS